MKYYITHTFLNSSQPWKLNAYEMNKIIMKFPRSEWSPSIIISGVSLVKSRYTKRLLHKCHHQNIITNTKIVPIINYE